MHSYVIFLYCAFNQVENFLLREEHMPPKLTHTTLSQSMKALVADELLKHLDVDVKVAVASGISEMRRIIDNQMKVHGIIKFLLLYICFLAFPIL